MAKKKKRLTLGERQQKRGRALFVGRNEEIGLFQETLRALQDENSSDEPKSVFNVFAQGGTGKTWLLREFEAICKDEGLEYVYIDAKLAGEGTITDLVDLLQSIRRHFSPTRWQKITRSNPFSEYDEAYRRFKGLEDKVKQKADSSTILAESKIAGKLVSSLATEGIKQIPGGSLVTAFVDQDTIQEEVQAAYRFTAKTIHEWLTDALGNVEDAEFFQNPETSLVEKFSKGLESFLNDKILVLMIDTYEELDSFDDVIRNRFLAKLSDVVPVLSGRHSLYDRCSLLWRESTHFLELRPFNQAEVTDYLQKCNLSQAELARKIYEFTRGVPLAVGLAADTAKLIPTLEQQLKLFDMAGEASFDSVPKARLEIIERVMERFLSQVPPAELPHIWAAIVLTTFNQARLTALIESLEFGKVAYDKLTQYSFILQAGSGFAVHDLVRDYTLRYLKDRQPQTYQDLHTKAADYYLQEQTNLETKQNKTISNNPIWRNLTKEYLYHRLQADERLGVQLLFEHIADALYERNYDYAYQLTQLIDRTVPITTMNLHQLNLCCQALRNGDETQACTLLETDLKRSLMPKAQQYILAMTLGNLRMSWPFDDYQTALEHFTTAYQAAQVTPAQDWPVLALARQGECYGHLQKWNLARDTLQQALTLAQALADPQTILRCQGNRSGGIAPKILNNV